MSEIIKPCPFCGGPGRAYFLENTFKNTGRRVNYVECKNECQEVTSETKAAAIKHWNKRHNMNQVRQLQEALDTWGNWYESLPDRKE